MFRRDADQWRELKERLKQNACNLNSFTHIERLASGTYNDVFKITFEGKVIIMRLSSYNDYTLSKVLELADRDPFRVQDALFYLNLDPTRVKNNYARLTNFLIMNNVCPHFVANYGSQDCKKVAQKVKSLLDPKRVAEIQQRPIGYHRYNNISFAEVFDTDLAKLMAQLPREEDLRSILFQVFYALAVLQHYIPTFRHNDLSTANILIKNVGSRRGESYVYELYGNHYTLWTPTFFAAINDFDLAHAEAFVGHLGGHKGHFTLQNMTLIKDALIKQHITRVHNPSFDTHILLWDLQRVLKNAPVRYTETLNWINGLFLSKSRYITQVHNNLFPVALIQSDYFKSLRSLNVTRPNNFSIRELPMDVYVGPNAANHAYPVPDAVTVTVVDPRVAPTIQRTPTLDHLPPVVYQYKDKIQAYDHAFVVKIKCTQSPKTTSIVAKRLGIPWMGDIQTMCNLLLDKVNTLYATRSIDIFQPVAQLYENCRAFLSKSELYDLGTLARMDRAVMKKMSKDQLCSTILHEFKKRAR